MKTAELQKLANWIGESWEQTGDEKWVRNTYENGERVTTKELIDIYIDENNL